MWASSAAFKSVESHKAETPDWPLGILCSSGSDKKTATYNRGRGWTEKMGLWRQCWRSESESSHHVGDNLRTEKKLGTSPYFVLNSSAAY